MRVGDVGVVQGDVNARRLPPMLSPDRRVVRGRTILSVEPRCAAMYRTNTCCIPRVLRGAADDDALGVQAHPRGRLCLNDLQPPVHSNAWHHSTASAA